MIYHLLCNELLILSAILKLTILVLNGKGDFANIEEVLRVGVSHPLFIIIYL